MNERISILDEIAASGLFDVMPLQTQRVLAAMARFADPSTRELKTPAFIIAETASSAAPGTRTFPNQVDKVIQQLCKSGILEKLSEGPPPTWRIACFQRLAEIKETIAGGELTLSHFDPGPSGFEEQRGPRPR